jgi:CYTH domain-containing protein
MPVRNKYSRIERERRFLIREFPSGALVTCVRRITDRYIEGTRLRLREQQDDRGSTVFKLTQKIPERGTGAQQGHITNMYLTKDEHALLAQLPAKLLSKTRYSVPPFGIDVFGGSLKGLVLAEAEFDSADSAAALVLPHFFVQEVSDDVRFTGGQLIRASRRDIQNWLGEFGIGLDG